VVKGSRQNRSVSSQKGLARATRVEGQVFLNGAAGCKRLEAKSGKSSLSKSTVGPSKRSVGTWRSGASVERCASDRTADRTEFFLAELGNEGGRNEELWLLSAERRADKILTGVSWLDRVWQGYKGVLER